jgi:ArsR family transcriptional regulator
MVLRKNSACLTRTCGGNGISVARSGRVPEGGMNGVLAIAKALSDENRVRVLMFLRDGELCVCQIIEMLGLAPSTISEHMSVLHRAGLVEARKDGRWIFYRLAGETGSGTVAAALRWLRDSLGSDRVVRSDARRLGAVKRTPVEDLCRCYKA